MPGCVHRQSGDRRFGVLKTPESRTHRVESLRVRRHGWTFGRRFWVLLASTKRTSPAGARPGRVVVRKSQTQR
jgi:hypothetical protein